MSKKTKSRFETLQDSAPNMLAVLRSTRDLLKNALNDEYFDREIFERLQERVQEVLELAVGDSNYVPAMDSPPTTPSIKPATHNSYKFYSNTDCEYFPCHKVADPEKFNCLFCYCPLYNNAECGGNFTMLPNGIKDCTNCTLPHYNYQAIIDALRKEMM